MGATFFVDPKQITFELNDGMVFTVAESGGTVFRFCTTIHGATLASFRLRKVLREHDLRQRDTLQQF